MKELQRLAEFEITELGIERFPPLEFSDWVALGHQLGRAHKALLWAAADWINAGEVQYAGKYTQAVAVLGRKYNTLSLWCGLAKMFPFLRRRKNLSFSHHALFYHEFRTLSEAQQDAYLDAAERDDLSVADLRELIRRDQAEVPRGENALPIAPHSPLKPLTEFHISLQRLGDPKGWKKEMAEAWWEEMEPTRQFIRRLADRTGRTW